MPNPSLHVSILSAGKDPHYALGLLEALVQEGVRLDFVGNDYMETAPAASDPLVNYLNLRGDQSNSASFAMKARRLVAYYTKLVRYAAAARPAIFHILWFNKFEWFDNSALIRYYRGLGKKLVFTAHNVSTADRDARGSSLSDWSLGYLYRHVDHIFVHTRKMEEELRQRFDVPSEKVSVVRFPVNNVTPRSRLSKGEARQRLGLDRSERILFFFGNIAPYKGVEDAVRALSKLQKQGLDDDLRLLIVGRIKECPAYWNNIRNIWTELGLERRITARIDYVPEEEVGHYFRAADVLLLPYRNIYQSGVLFLSYNQGLPVIASDVGAMAESVVEGETGFVCRPANPRDLADKIAMYFESPLYRGLECRRRKIIDFVEREHSWKAVAEQHCEVYRQLSGRSGK